MQFYVDGKYYIYELDEAKDKLPEGVVLDAFKNETIKEIKIIASSLRAKIASSDATKIAEYRIKEELANNPDADVNELSLLKNEAESRGVTLDDLLNLIKEKAKSYRQEALKISVLEFEAINQINTFDLKTLEQEKRNILRKLREYNE